MSVAALDAASELFSGQPDGVFSAVVLARSSLIPGADTGEFVFLQHTPLYLPLCVRARQPRAL